MKNQPLKYRFFLGLLSSLGYLPLGVLYAIMAPARFTLHRVVGYRKKVIRKNLRNSFPEKSEKELRGIEKNYYRHLTDVMVETVKLLHISDKEISKRIQITNPGLLNEILGKGESVVLMLGHVGNWEWIPQLTAWVNPKVQFGEIYRQLHDKEMGRIMYRIRDRWEGVTQIKQNDAVRTILRWNRNGNWIVGFIADQRPSTASLNHWMKFLNQDTAVVTGGEVIGKHTGARYLYMDIEKPKRGHYTLTYKEIIPDPASESEFPVTEKYLSMLEETIKRDPSLWLWSHNRWKYKKKDV